MIRFAKATEADMAPILSNLRDQEQATIDRLGIDAEAVLRKALGEPAWTCFVDEVPAAMFGLSGAMVGEQKLWMLTTPVIMKRQIALLRASRDFVRGAREAYGPVLGMCDRRNDVSRRWLKWIGFREFEDGEFIKMRYG